MRTFLLAIAGTAVLLASAPTSGQLMSGNDLLRRCLDAKGPPSSGRPPNKDSWLDGSAFGYCFGYVEDVVDAMGQGRELVGGRTYCILAGTTLAQFEEISIQYLREHPALRNYSAAGLVAEALEKAFPCR
jgi:hypothetical protein